MQTLIIDNYDSFTFNLYQYVAEITGEMPVVIRNNQLKFEELKQIEYNNIIISPGPGRPDVLEDFGVCISVLQQLDVPILGVCLGHQGIAHAFGGKVIHAPEAMHGRVSKVYHEGHPLFEGIPVGFSVVRYHSLIVDKEIPPELQKIAWTEDDLIMGIAHKEKPIWGVQFHPESICTEYGKNILKNYLSMAEDYCKKNTHVKKHDKELSPIDISVIPRKSLPIRMEAKYNVKVRELSSFKDPEQVFLHFYGNHENAIWLDSSSIVEGFSRFSFMGGSGGELFFKVSYVSSKKEITVSKNGSEQVLNESIFDYLRRETCKYYTETPNIEFNFNCGFVGYFGYEIKQECNSQLSNKSDLPDAIFLFIDRLIVFDHKYKKMFLLNLYEQGSEYDADDWFDTVEEGLRSLNPKSSIIPLTCSEPVKFRLSRNYKTYMEDIYKCLQYIKDGESYEICLTNKIHTDIDINPLSYYRVLRQTNPAPYGTFLRFNDICIAGSSPERFIYIDKTALVESKPMKGTIKRGKTKEEDEFLFTYLQNDEKTRAENLMICDLIRNDLGIVCEVGSVNVPSLLTVETYATVHQMISLIRGKLRDDMHAIDCIRTSFPGGSMTGAPKKRTMEFIDELEKEARGVYSGSIGYFALNNSADFNIVIRTAVITPGRFSVGVGGAIISLSDPQEEFDEIMLKGMALMNSAQQLVPEDIRKEYIVEGVE
ncbi:MAG: aminodeoxychorismate synthase component I [Bacillota bacterium]